MSPARRTKPGCNLYFLRRILFLIHINIRATRLHYAILLLHPCSWGQVHTQGHALDRRKTLALRLCAGVGMCSSGWQFFRTGGGVFHATVPFRVTRYGGWAFILATRRHDLAPLWCCTIHYGAARSTMVPHDATHGVTMPVPPCA